MYSLGETKQSTIWKCSRVFFKNDKYLEDTDKIYIFLKVGNQHEFYVPMLTLIGISIGLQVYLQLALYRDISDL